MGQYDKQFAAVISSKLCPSNVKTGENRRCDQPVTVQFKPSYEAVIFENLVGEDFHLNTLKKPKPHIA